MVLAYTEETAREMFDEAKKIGKDIYVFKITDYLSNNGTHFTERPTNITLILNFGNISNEPVIVEWIRSFEKLEDI